MRTSTRSRGTDQPTLTLEARKAEEPDAVSVTAAFGGVAETGTLVLVSGGDSPTTLNFLPENHIVVLWADRITGDYEAQWSALRERYGAAPCRARSTWSPARRAAPISSRPSSSAPTARAGSIS